MKNIESLLRIVVSNHYIFPSSHLNSPLHSLQICSSNMAISLPLIRSMTLDNSPCNICETSMVSIPYIWLTINPDLSLPSAPDPEPDPSWAPHRIEPKCIRIPQYTLLWPHEETTLWVLWLPYGPILTSTPAHNCLKDHHNHPKQI